MNVTIDLPPDVAARLARKATGGGQDLTSYVRRLAVRDADAEALARVLNEDRAHRPYNPAGLRTALAAFDEGDALEQRETLAHLRSALDRDRPGQRRAFGPGVNPMPAEGEA